MPGEDTDGEEPRLHIQVLLEQNHHSDSQFLPDSLERGAKEAEPITLVTDGHLRRRRNEKLANEKSVTLIATGLSGRQTRPILAEFKFDESGDKVLGAPCGT